MNYKKRQIDTPVAPNSRLVTPNPADFGAQPSVGPKTENPPTSAEPADAEIENLGREREEALSKLGISAARNYNVNGGPSRVSTTGFEPATDASKRPGGQSPMRGCIFGRPLLSDLPYVGLQLRRSVLHMSLRPFVSASTFASAVQARLSSSAFALRVMNNRSVPSAIRRPPPAISSRA